jgi:uncharacterized protein (TIGR03905 family)
MKLSYKTSGVCSRTITADIEDGKVYNLRFEGGCNGNTKGISALVEGMEINDVIDRLEGIKCGFRGTSCPDQLAQALKSIQS